MHHQTPCHDRALAGRWRRFQLTSVFG
jgi:hypothetical protein